MKATILNYSLQRLKDPSLKLDEQFTGIMMEVEKFYCILDKLERNKAEQWARKLCQHNLNIPFKHDRNLYAMMLLDSVLSYQLLDPFNKLPPEGLLPSLNKKMAKMRLSDLPRKLKEACLNGLLKKSKAFAVNVTQNMDRPSFKSCKVEKDDQENSSRIESKKQRLKADSKKDLQTQTLFKKDHILSEIFGTQIDELDESAIFRSSNNSAGNIQTEKSCLMEQVEKPRLSTAEWEKPEKIKRAEKNNSLCEIVDSQTVAKMQKVHSKEIKEILGLRVEVDLLKFSEESLKKELNQKLIEQNALIREIESLAAQNKKLVEQNGVMSEFFATIKKRTEEGHIQFKDFANAEATVNEINKLCMLLDVSPIIKAPKLIEKAYSIGRMHSETAQLGQSLSNQNANTSFSDNQQKRAHFDTSVSLTKNYEEVDELAECILKNSLYQDSFNQSAVKPQQNKPVAETPVSPIAFDTFRYNLEGARRELSASIEGTIGRDSAAFNIEESINRSTEKSLSSTKQPEIVTYFDQFLREHELEGVSKTLKF